MYNAGPKKEVERRAAFEKEKYLKVCPVIMENDFPFNPFQVKWLRVPDLVEKRRVFLKRGWAYVPSQEQSSIIFQEFETQLDKALEMTARRIRQ